MFYAYVDFMHHNRCQKQKLQIVYQIFWPEQTKSAIQNTQQWEISHF